MQCGAIRSAHRRTFPQTSRKTRCNRCHWRSSFRRSARSCRRPDCPTIPSRCRSASRRVSRRCNRRRQMLPVIVLPIEPQDELAPILAALAENEPDAEDRLTAYARQSIVADAYARAQRDWSERIRAGLCRSARCDRTPSPGHSRKRAGVRFARPRRHWSLQRPKSPSSVLSSRRSRSPTTPISTRPSPPTGGGRSRARGAYADAIGESIGRQMKSIAENLPNLRLLRSARPSSFRKTCATNCAANRRHWSPSLPNNGNSSRACPARPA